MPTNNDLDDFTRAYIEAALWSSTDESHPDGGLPLDKNYTIADLDPETRNRMCADCDDFIAENGPDLVAFGKMPSQNGHDFWLTRNDHGSGFWARNYRSVAEKETYERLTLSAESFGHFHLYVGVDAKIYHE